MVGVQKFEDLICRASISISNNIAESFDRSSTGFRRFLYIALAPCSEVKLMLYITERLSFLTTNQTEKLKQSCIQISKIITGLIKSLKI